jgi:hypothetical protein
LLPGFDPLQVLGEEIDPDLAADGSLAVFEAGSRRFAVIEDGAVDSIVEMNITSEGEGAWRTEIADERAAVMRLDGNRLVLVETTDHPNKAVTTFDPPLLLIEDGMGDGYGARTEHTVVVRSLEDVSRIVDRGTAEQSLVRESDQVLLLPDGQTRRAVRLARTLTISLGRAKVKEVTTSWYAPDLGLAAEQSKEEVKVFGPLGWTRRRLLVRVP